jgi:hypothetical protein
LARVRVSVLLQRRWTREEIGRWWRTPRVSASGERPFIGAGERRRASWRGRATGRRHRAASPDREVEDNCLPRWVPGTESVRWLGRLGLAIWAALVGCGPISSPLFFC